MMRTVMRALLRQPSFTVAAAATLAIGIAASTALFTAVDAVLLRPLPYPRSQDLYTVRTYFPNGRFTIGLVGSEEMARLADLRDVVAAVGMSVRFDGTLLTGNAPRQVVGYGVSDGFFPLFGVPMQAGRPIQRGDGVRGAAPVAVVSHKLWRTVFGQAPDLVGRLITLSNRPVKVIGITPSEFDMPGGADLWVNETTDPPDIGHRFDGYLRLRPGATLTPALQSRMNLALEPLGRKYPDQELGRAFAVRSLLDATVGDLGPILVILFGATGLLLALAAVNVTNLLLARAAGRARDIALRSALGASRGRMLTQLLAESTAVAVLGGAAGIAIAYVALEALLRFGAARLPRLAGVAIDVRVLGFALLVVGATGIVVGIVPALRMADTDIGSLMNEHGRSVRGSRSTRRWLRVFAVVEIAAAVAIVAGAARLVRSYQHLTGSDPGFQPQGRLVLDVTPPAPRPPFLERRNAWWDATEARLREAGAVQVAASSAFPLEHDWDSTTFVDMVSRPDVPPERRPNARLRIVTPQFFGAMGIRLLQGRLFSTADTTRSQPVGVVNEAFVARNLGGASPLGERIKSLHGHMEGGRFVDDYVVIVGVVNDVRYATLVDAPEPIVYGPFSQFFASRTSIVVTTQDGAPERHLAAFESAIRAVDPGVTIDARPAAAIVAASIERQRLGMWLMLGFATAALLLATVGMFGVIACLVSQRIGEMAVRQALGATRTEVFTAIMVDGARLTLAGMAAGVAIAWWTGTLVGAYVFDVAARDPAVLGVSALTVALVAAASTALPARRAAMTDLPRALRTE